MSSLISDEINKCLVIGTLNINCLQTDSKKAMLKDFINNRDYAILCLQEVALDNFEFLSNYQYICNIGNNKRGTAILVKDNYNLTDVIKLPCGRGISCKINNISIVNVYAPSGSHAKNEREEFFKLKLPILLLNHTEHVVITGDFNSVLHSKDSIGKSNYSEMLKIIVNKMNLEDAWELLANETQFTFIRSGTGSRLDRFYISQSMKYMIKKIEIQVAAFTDHSAVNMHIHGFVNGLRTGFGYWKLNTLLLEDSEIKEEFKLKWENLKKKKTRFKDLSYWWEECAKPQIKSFFKNIQKRKKINEDRRILMYNNCLDEYYKKKVISKEDEKNINYFKALITTIYRKRLDSLKISCKTNTIIHEEKASIFHTIAEHKRRKSFQIKQLKDGQKTATTTKEILQLARAFYSRKFNKNFNIVPFTDYSPLVDKQTMTDDESTNINEEITFEEVEAAVMKAAKKKSPGSDGIPSDFYQLYWDIIGKDLYEVLKMEINNKRLTKSQLEGVIVLIKKSSNAKDIKHFRPITLLNCDYKILARIVANRLRPFYEKTIHKAQTAGVSGRSIITCIKDIRDIIEFKRTESKKGGILSLDFEKAFDSVDHQYMFHLLEHYGLTGSLLQCIKSLYLGSMSRIQINGFLSNPFNIRSGVRQGCPLSMILYCITIDPLIRQIINKLSHSNLLKEISTLKAFADDISVFIDDRKQMQQVLQTVEIFGKYSGAKLNLNKTKFMSLENKLQTRLPDVCVVKQLHILGIIFTTNFRETIKVNYEKIITSIRGLIKDTILRDFTLQQRIWYVHSYVLSKVWYVAQILPAKIKHIDTIKRIVASIIWKGELFRIPFNIMCKQKNEGGYELISIKEKCNALYCKEILRSITDDNTFSTHWIKYWINEFSVQNPPNNIGALTKYPLVYHSLNLCIYNEYMQKILLAEEEDEEEEGTAREIQKSTTKAIYESFMDKQFVTSRLCIQNPNVKWKQVWKNVHGKFFPNKISSTWYKVIYNIYPTRQRLYNINLASTPLCTTCCLEDTILHRLTSCIKISDIWDWMKHKIGMICRTNKNNIPDCILIQPDYNYFLPSKNNALTWLLGYYIYYTMTNKSFPLEEFQTFLKCEYCKIDNEEKKDLFMKYIDIILDDSP